MKELKIKIKLGQFEVELAGDSDDVKETLKGLKEEGFGNLLGNSVIMEQAIIMPEEEPMQLSSAKKTVDNSGDFSSIREIVIKQLPNTEVEWVLVYAFYVVHEKESFSKQDVQAMYEKSNRWSSSNKSNFTHNFNQGFKKGYFTTLNDTENLLTEAGTTLAKEILSRTEGIVKNNKTSKSAKSDSNSNKGGKSQVKSDLKVIGELNLNPKDSVGLAKFLEDYNHSTSSKKNLLFVYYLSEILKIESITHNHIFSCYRWLEMSFPNAFVQSLRDTKAKNGWLLSAKDGEIKISPKGLNEILKLKN